MRFSSAARHLSRWLRHHPSGRGLDKRNASIESMFGLLGFAFATGLLYGRFPRPNSKIIYSKKAVVVPYKDQYAFEFRIANARKNQLIDVEVQTVLTLKE